MAAKAPVKPYKAGVTAIPHAAFSTDPGGLESRAVPAVLIVNTPLDVEDAADGLREAVSEAALSGDSMAINLGPGEHTIVLTAGQLSVCKSLTIQGPDADKLAISGDHFSAVFEVAANVQVTVAGLDGTDRLRSVVAAR